MASSCGFHEPYLSHNRYLQRVFGEKVYRVAVDAGFSCPHRAAGRSSPGCFYCDAVGARAPYLDTVAHVGDQISRGLAFLRRRYGVNRYSLYFQAYTSTYGSCADLRELYDFSLAQADFAEFIVSTRPDCLPPEIVDLLASYQTSERQVWVELGLQSSHEETLRRINRGHGVAEFEDAFYRLRERGIKVAVHLILGLPGEGWPEMESTLGYVADLRPEGVKFHNLHVPAGAPLAEDFRRGELSLYSSQRHLEYVVRAVQMMPPETVIMRLTCDTPRERGQTPGNIWEKSLFISRIRDKMLREKRFQGDCCGSTGWTGL